MSRTDSHVVTSSETVAVGAPAFEVELAKGAFGARVDDVPAVTPRATF